MANYEITVTRSAGSDGAVVVFIDGDFSDTGLRIVLNDNEDLYASPAWQPAPEGEENEAKSVHLPFDLSDVEYLSATEPRR